MASQSNVRTGILIILDGFGVNPKDHFNAIAGAKKPTLDRLYEKYPHTTLDASEHHVGLPAGFMGNSEVGHLNLGAGRVVYQDFSLISKAIEDGVFFQNEALLSVMQKCQKGAVHLMGLVSDGGVHSHISHLFSLLKMAEDNKVSKVYIHVFTDGRDTSPISGVGFLRQLQDYCLTKPFVQIATVQGRFYAMDRDKRWERTQLAYDAIMEAKAENHFSDPVAYLENCYEKNLTDEFIPPAVSKKYLGVSDQDGFIFFNFRADRARQITHAMSDQDFKFFTRGKSPCFKAAAIMTPYEESLTIPKAFGKPKITQTIGEIVSKKGWKQLRIAETEKYAHVTYFFNGGEEKPFSEEERVLVPSPKEVKTYDLKPEMSASEITSKLLEKLKSSQPQFVVVNYANGDMVGHTGNYRAAVKAVETLDVCLGKLVDWVEGHNAFALLTADHGNCEKMQDEDGLPLTAHTTLPVPFILIDPQKKNATLRSGGVLADVAPTMLDLWDLNKPSDMSGKSLIS